MIREVCTKSRSLLKNVETKKTPSHTHSLVAV